LVDDASPVEYDQPLFLVDPSWSFLTLKAQSLVQ
jgi:hypothetical protein